MPANKEPRFFAVPRERTRYQFHGPGDDEWLAHFVTERADYDALFEGAAETQMVGEASTDYLYQSDVVSERLVVEAPDVRMVAVLRHPAERAYSNWMHHRRDGRETLSFEDALTQEDSRVDCGWAWWWHYKRRGQYGQQLRPLLESFKEQLLVILYDEYVLDPVPVLQRVANHIGVRPPTSIETDVNASYDPRGGIIGNVARHLFERHRGRVGPVLPPRVRAALKQRVVLPTMRSRRKMQAQTRRDLTALYRSEIELTSSLTGHDLDHWL